MVAGKKMEIENPKYLGMGAVHIMAAARAWPWPKKVYH